MAICVDASCWCCILRAKYTNYIVKCKYRTIRNYSKHEWNEHVQLFVEFLVENTSEVHVTYCAAVERVWPHLKGHGPRWRRRVRTSVSNKIFDCQVYSYSLDKQFTSCMFREYCEPRLYYFHFCYWKHRRNWQLS